MNFILRTIVRQTHKFNPFRIIIFHEMSCDPGIYLRGYSGSILSHTHRGKLGSYQGEPAYRCGVGRLINSVLGGLTMRKITRFRLSRWNLLA